MNACPLNKIKILLAFVIPVGIHSRGQCQTSCVCIHFS